MGGDFAKYDGGGKRWVVKMGYREKLTHGLVFSSLEPKAYKVRL